MDISEILGKIIGIILFIMLISYISGLFKEKETWSLFIYNDDYERINMVDGYSDKEDCMRSGKLSKSGIYECGSNCKYDYFYDTYMCKETVR